MRPAMELKELLERFNRGETIGEDAEVLLAMAVYSFLEEYDLSGKNVILYCTHEGSRFSGTVDTVKEMEPDATVTEGLSIRGGEVADSEADVRDSI
jgi:flavodoxin